LMGMLACHAARLDAVPSPPRATMEPSVSMSASATAPVAPIARRPVEPQDAHINVTIGPPNDADRAAIALAKRDLHDCAVRGLERDPLAKGKVVFVVQVDTNGVVSIGAIPFNGVGGFTAQCMAAVVRQARFGTAVRTFEVDVAVTR
jgi:hypothetical protein